MRSQAPVPDRLKRATQGGDSRWAFMQTGADPVRARNLRRPCAQTLNGRYMVQSAPTETYEPSGSSGLHAELPVPATESAPRRCPEQEGRNPSHTESARRRCPDVEVPQPEAAGGAASVQRGHGEDTDVGGGPRRSVRVGA